MGYLGTMLPRYLARLGADVHYLSLDLPPYWQIPDMREHYKRLVGEEWLTPGRVAVHDGYTVHVLNHHMVGGQPRMPGLRRKLQELKPDVVYSLSAVGWLALECAFAKPFLGFKLFTGSHMLASGFPFARRKRPWLSLEAIKVILSRWIPGRFVSLMTEKCYAPTVDCAEIAWRFFGVQRRKVEVMHLGVDTEVFFPVSSAADESERSQTRRELDVLEDEILVVNSGKLTAEKNVLLVAQAVAKLRASGRAFRLLCIGEGGQRDALAAAPWTTVLPFQPYQGLARFYRAADIAIWPTTESTSMLDAAACGVPIIVSDGIVYRDHVDGNGLVVRMNDLEDLLAKLIELMDPKLRARLGKAGAEKMATRFSWREHVRRRMTEYQQSIRAAAVSRP